MRRWVPAAAAGLLVAALGVLVPGESVAGTVPVPAVLPAGQAPYRPMARLTTMAVIPASTALAIGDASRSPIGLDAGACP